MKWFSTIQLTTSSILSLIHFTTSGKILFSLSLMVLGQQQLPKTPAGRMGTEWSWKASGKLLKNLPCWQIFPGKNQETSKQKQTLQVLLKNSFMFRGIGCQFLI